MLLNFLGIKQLVICISQLDGIPENDRESTFQNLSGILTDLLLDSGWNSTFVSTRVPTIPISAKYDINVISNSTLKWWTGCSKKNLLGKLTKIVSLVDVFKEFLEFPTRDAAADFILPIVESQKIKGIGFVATGRVGQGEISPETPVKFLCTNVPEKEIQGIVKSVEISHKSVPFGIQGELIGIRISDVSDPIAFLKCSRRGYIVDRNSNFRLVRKFTALVQPFNLPAEHKISVGSTFLGFCEQIKTPLKISKINWKQSKKQPIRRVEFPDFFSIGNLAEVVFEANFRPIIVVPFSQKNSPRGNFGRVVLLNEQKKIVLVGKVESIQE